MGAKVYYFLFVAFLGLCVTSTAFAAGIFVVHGINGTDLGLDESFPVDISVNGECALPGVTFRTISDPISLDPGQYDIEISLADGSCSGLLAVVSTVDVQLGESASLVAHLTEAGTPTLTKFVNDVRSTEHDSARVTVRHAAVAPPVSVVIRKGHRRIVFRDIRNTEQSAAESNADERLVTLFPENQPRIGPISLTLGASESTIVYAVGSLKNGTFEPLIQILDTAL